jgi:cytochrome P450
MDVYADFANRVLCINAGYNLGLPRADTEKFRALIDDMLHREPGQVGMVSARNQAAAGQLFGYLTEYVAAARRQPELAQRHTRLFFEAEIDGRKLGDEEIVAYLFSLLVTGSETTPMTVAATLYYLARHPDQKRAVLADHALIRPAFLETARFDQPTNMLARRARADFELSGRRIRAGQNLLFIYASANRDGEEFERPDEFDIYRKAARDLSFGVGGHKCLGAHLAVMIGVMMLEEWFAAIEDYELLDAQCQRAYGEHLSGFLQVPVRFSRRAN